jgi:hypothetical protein
MAEIDHIKLINQRISNVENILSQNNSIELSSIIKNTITYQLQKINNAKKAINKKIQNTKENIKKLYKSQKNKIQALIKNSIGSLTNNKCIKAFLNGIKTIFNNSKKLITGMKEKFKNLLKGVFDILSSVKSFIFDKVVSGFATINKLLYGIPGKTWATISYIFKTVYKVFNWTLKIGKMALEFVWSGIKTIFNAGLSVISTSLNYLTKGTKAFFSWWFKMFIKTMFSPTMWIINIPLFAAITAVTFSAAAIVLAVSSSIILPIFETTFSIVKTVGGWIYEGISWLFHWLASQYNGSFLQKEIVDPFIGFIKDNIPETIKNLYGTVISWGETAYKWINQKGGGIINTIKKTIKDITNAYKEYPGKTAFTKFLNFLVNKEFTWDIPGTNKQIALPLLPALAKNYLKSKYGFILSYEGTPHSIYSATQLEIKRSESQLVSSSIELEYAKLFKEGEKQGKKLSSTEILKKLDEAIIPTLSSTVAKTISDRSFKNAIEKGIENAQTSYLYKNEQYINPEVVKSLAYSLSQLRLNIEKMKTGFYDGRNHYIIKDMVNSINATSGQIYNIQKRISTIKNVERGGKDIIALVDAYNKQEIKLSLLPSQKEREKSKEFLDARNTAQIARDWLRIGIMGYRASTVYESDVREYAAVKNNTSIVIPFRNESDIEKAHGDIIIPNKQEMNKTIALDNRGIEFIRSKVKEILIPKQENIKENDDNTNITIIEEHNNYTDSYELYTMNQLSQGILRT